MIPNCPMFAVRLWITTSPYRWPIGSLPSTCLLCTPRALRLHHAGINSWSVDSNIVLHSSTALQKPCPGDGGITHLWNVDLLQRDYTAPCPRRLSFSYSSQWELEISLRNLRYWHLANIRRRGIKASHIHYGGSCKQIHVTFISISNSYLIAVVPWLHPAFNPLRPSGNYVPSASTISNAAFCIYIVISSQVLYSRWKFITL
jgi:hypothetical protein